jgi:hypothetical protein
VEGNGGKTKLGVWGCRGAADAIISDRRRLEGGGRPVVGGRVVRRRGAASAIGRTGRGRLSEEDGETADGGELKSEIAR